MKVKPVQIFMRMECHKKVLVEFFHQEYWLILYLKWINHYPQKFLGECKYIAKEKKMKYITDNLEISSDESDEGVSDKGVFNV